MEQTETATTYDEFYPDDLPSLDVEGNLEFQRYIYALIQEMMNR